MARTDPTIYMRIPQELKDALDTAAEKNRRSLTAEVVSRLSASLGVGNFKVVSTYADGLPTEDGPPPTIYAQLAIEAERKALALEAEKVSLLQEELWTINRWREASYGMPCTAEIADLTAELNEFPEELMELDEEADQARANADNAASYVPELPGPWHRRQGPSSTIEVAATSNLSKPPK